MKFDVQVNDDQRSNDPQNGFIGRDEGDIEELLENMVIVGEDRDEDIQWDRVVDDVEDINSSQENNVRGVDQILRQDSRHGSHNQNPIRMWTNPDANEIRAQIEYRPEQNTLLSNAEAVDAFNRIFNDQGAPSLNLQIAAEEHYLNQNSEALGSFEDIGNIKWAILEDEGAHREEAPNTRGEHLTTDTNTQYDIHGFYVEEDGKPLEPEEVNSLMKKIMRRDQFTVPDSLPSEVPEIMLEYDSVEEAVSDREISREEFDSEYKRAQKDDVGLVNEEGNLTLKGWLSAVDLQAGDLRELEEVANGQETIEFDTGLGLPQISTDGVVSINAEHPYMVDRRLNGRIERGRVNFREGEMEEELESLMEDFSWMGLDSSQMTIEQEVNGEISFAQYLEDFHDVEVEYSENGRIVLEKDQVNTFMFEELAKNATFDWQGDENLVEEIDITNGQTQDFEKNLSVMRYSDEAETRIDIEESDLPEEITKRIKDDFFESLEIGTDKDGVKAMYGESSMYTKSWEKALDLYEGEEGEFEFDIWKKPLEIVLEPYQDEINELQENYDEETDNHLGFDIPDFHKASDELLEGIRKMEELGWFSTEIVEDSKTEIEVQASDSMEYRETIERLKEIEHFEFGSTYSMDKESREARTSWEENEKVPLKSVSANIEVAADDEDEIRERLEDYEEELEVNNLISTREELKDDIIPKLKYLVHEQYGSNPLIQPLGKVIPEVHEILDKEWVKDYENLSGQIDYAEFTEDEEGTETWEKALSEELLEELGEMYEEGLIDVELDYDVRTSHQSERVQMPDIGYVEDYHEVGDEDKEKLRELDRRGLISLDEGDYRIDVREELEADEVVTVDGSVTVEPDELEMDEEPVELEGEYRKTGDAVYEANEELRRIAENLNPLNFQKDSYEDIEVETSFRYEDSSQAAV